MALTPEQCVVGAKVELPNDGYNYDGTLSYRQTTAYEKAIDDGQDFLYITAVEKMANGDTRVALGNEPGVLSSHFFDQHLTAYEDFQDGDLVFIPKQKTNRDGAPYEEFLADLRKVGYSRDYLVVATSRHKGCIRLRFPDDFTHKNGKRITLGSDVFRRQDLVRYYTPEDPGDVFSRLLNL